MAQISEYRKLSSKIEGLKEKIKFKTDILELDQRLTKEKSEELINKFIQKENEKLDLIRFGLSCLNEEVNKRLPRAMNKYNRKDYWSRREAIQTWRVALKTDEANFVTRSLMIINFEREIYRNPEQDPAKLWSDLKLKYLIILLRILILL